MFQNQPIVLRASSDVSVSNKRPDIPFGLKPPGDAAKLHRIKIISGISGEI
jgi:hypothetical protein